MTASPIILEAQPVGSEVLLRVVARSSAPIEASFSLKVMAGSNRSTHRGMASVQSGETAILSTIFVTTAPSGVWRALLRVEPSGAMPYELIKQSD